MIKVIGTISCDRCKELVKDMKKSEIEYEYVCLNDLPMPERLEQLNLAIQAGVEEFPFIVKDGQIIQVEDL